MKIIANLPQNHNDVLDTLESLIDANSVRYVLESLAEVCSLKADHIRENWQDERTAKAWDDQSVRIMEISFPQSVTS